MFRRASRPAAPILLLAAGAAFLAGGGREPGGDPADAVVAEGRLGASLHRFLSRAADSGFNGSVLVARAGRVVFHRSYGWADSARTRPFTNRTRFWIASNSKQFTAAALLVLEEGGRLSLEDSLPRFLPDVPAGKRGITLHRLLTHTSGLEQHYAADGIVDRDQAVAALLRAPLAAGKEFSYSNDAYNLAAAIVEIVGGVPFETFLTTRILGPAGLGDTGFWGPREHPEVAAILDGFAEPEAAGPNWGFRGATGMFSTTGDLYRWGLALEGRRVLTGAAVARLRGRHVPRGEIQVGYGWFTSPTPRGTPSVWTRGYESFGHGAVLATYPAEGVILSIGTNSGEHPDGTPVSHRLLRDLDSLLFLPGNLR